MEFDRTGRELPMPNGANCVALRASKVEPLVSRSGESAGLSVRGPPAAEWLMEVAERPAPPHYRH